MLRGAGFGKMKTLLGGDDAAANVAVVAGALEGSDWVELNADKTGIRRRFPVPTEDPAAPRIVHVAQFATEVQPIYIIEP